MAVPFCLELIIVSLLIIGNSLSLFSGRTLFITKITTIALENNYQVDVRPAQISLSNDARKKKKLRKTRPIIIACPAYESAEDKKVRLLANELRLRRLDDILKLIEGHGSYLDFDFIDGSLTINLTEPENNDNKALLIRKHVPTLMEIAHQVYRKKTMLSIVWREYAFSAEYKREIYQDARLAPIIRGNTKIDAK